MTHERRSGTRARGAETSTAQVARMLPSDSPPPHNLEAEVAVLGSLLLDPNAITRVQDVISADDFYRENHAVIYKAALGLLREGTPIDNVTVAAELERNGVLQRVGGRSHLAMLQESVPTVANAEHYAREVHRLAARRRVAAEARQLAEAANDPAVDLAILSDRAASLPDVASPDGSWGQPLPLVDTATLPEFPLQALPAWCAAYAAALADATQTPADLAGMIVLAALATCAGGRVRVEVRPGWSEPLNLYVLVALPPGERKSAVFEAVTAPLSAFGEERAVALAPVITEAAIRRRALERAADTAQKEAARARTESAREAAILRATGLATEAEAVKVPASFRLLADDATPEALASLLAEQGGRMAVLSPEGGVFSQMAGRYSMGRATSANLEVYLKGHAGDRLRVDRKGRPPEYVRQPALTIGVAIQPGVLRAMAEIPELRELGVLARFLYALPLSRMGSRAADPDPVPASLAHEYASKLCVLARSLDAASPRLIRFSAAGQHQLNDYAAILEPRLGEQGDLRPMADWAGKLSGAIARVAGLVHLAGRAQSAWVEKVELDTVDAAISVGDYAIAHAQAAFALMGADPVVELARRVLAWIADRGLTEFSRRDAFYHLRCASLPKVTDLDPALTLLVDHEYLAPVPIVRSSVGGRPSQRFRVNPYAQNPHNPPNRSRAAGSVGSVGFVTRRACE